jgi:hypothetical protein
MLIRASWTLLSVVVKAWAQGEAQYCACRCQNSLLTLACDIVLIPALAMRKETREMKR